MISVIIIFGPYSEKETGRTLFCMKLDGLKWLKVDGLRFVHDRPLWLK